MSGALLFDDTNNIQSEVIASNNEVIILEDSFETYEFLPPSGIEDNQFFVTNDDGTILFTKPVQYVGEVRGNLDEMYDVATQQYYVDVNDENTEVDTPEYEGINNNLYASSYLVQSLGESAQVQVQPSHQPVSNVENEASQINNENSANYTEITLNDEQYKLLEQRGWLMCEMNDKVFLLDSMGLHDITNNQKMIDVIRHIHYGTLTQSSTDSHQFSSEEIVMSADTETQPMQLDMVETTEYTQEDDNEELNHKEEVNEWSDITEDLQIDEVEDKEKYLPHDEESNSSIADVNTTKNFLLEVPEISKKANTIHIKVGFDVIDLPENIVLGTTPNGKRLVAKLIKPKVENDKDISKPNGLHGDKDLIISSKENVQKIVKESKFDFSDAAALVSKLMKTPSFKKALLNKNLIFSKTVKRKNDAGKQISASEPSVVFGKLENGQLVKLSELSLNDSKSIGNTNGQKPQGCLQINVVETLRGDSSVVAITMTQKYAPSLANKVKKVQNPLFSCSACAEIFTQQADYKEHQETCMEKSSFTVEDAPTEENHILVKDDPEDSTKKMYECIYCSTRFNRLSSCQRHIHVHLKGKITDNTKSYKCKMCPSTYFHSSSLAKHVMMHIVAKNKIKKTC